MNEILAISLLLGCEGAFISDSGKLVTVSKFDPGDGEERLFFMDFESGYARILFENAGELSGGPALFSPSPVELKLGCTAQTIEWKIAEKQFSGNRLSMKQEQVEFSNGNVRLSGTLHLPSTAPPHPAVLLLHGSGKSTRYSFGPMPLFFAANGFAVLTYDKRGTGQSQGSFPAATFQDFIGDGAAAISYLRFRKDIDASRLAAWGSSQGGFIAAGVSQRSREIRLLINQSGMFVPAWKQEVYRVRSEMEAQGYAAKEIEEALDYLNEFFNVGKTGKNWKQLNEWIARLENKAWFGLLPRVENREELMWFWKTVYSQDPAYYLEGVQCAVRGVFGSLDKSTPVTETILNMRSTLKKSGNPDFKSVIIPRANHGLLEAKSGSETEIPALTHFVPEAFEVQKKWLLELISTQPKRLRPS
ncbi:alpha/beta fold hydrolase [bacterium]|nr:alpha/beta fold hydrolase [bacterium]